MRARTTGEMIQAEALAGIEAEERREQSWFVSLLQTPVARELLRRVCANARAGAAAGWPAFDASDYIAIGKRELAQEYIDKIVKYGTADDIADLVHGKEKA